MKIKAIILWTQAKLLPIRFNRWMVGVRITLTAFKFWLYVHSLRLAWNWIITPLYVHYENRVVALIESGRVNVNSFVTPTRLTYYSLPPVVEDRYDYSHEDSYGL